MGQSEQKWWVQKQTEPGQENHGPNWKCKGIQKSEENFEAWNECLEFFLKINNIPEEKRGPTFLTLIGTQNFITLKALCKPKKLKEIKYPKLVKTFGDYVNQRLLFIGKFCVWTQRENELISDYVAELQKLSAHCNFKDKLEEQLRDQITHGIINSTLKKKLYEEPDLTYKKCKAILSSGWIHYK